MFPAHGLLLCAALAAAPAATPQEASTPPAAEALTEAVRGFFAEAGVALDTFECDARPPLEPGDTFGCGGTDESGNVFGIEARMGDGGVPRIVTRTVPASLVPPETMAASLEACRAGIAAHDARDWQTLLRITSPPGRPASEARLTALQRSRRVGALGGAELETYTVTDTGRGILGFVARTGAGARTLDCGTRSVSGEDRIAYWRVGLLPGTPEHVAYLAEFFAVQLGVRLGRPVSHIEGPLDQLSHSLDAVEATAHFLDSDERLSVLVVQAGSHATFANVSYAIVLLDAELVSRELIPNTRSLACPDRTIPAQGEMSCRLTLANGVELDARLRRDGLDPTIEFSPPPLASAAEIAASTSVVEVLRAPLEERLRHEGVDLEGFDCDVTDPPATGETFDCTLTATGGEQRSLVVSVEDDGALYSLLETRPGPPAPTPELARLEGACRAWLEAVAGADWAGAREVLHPEARENHSADSFESVLGDMLPIEWTGPHTHAIRSLVQHEFEYALETARGAMRFRCGPAPSLRRGPTLRNFTLGPRPGSRAEVDSFTALITAWLAGHFGDPVQRVEAPFRELRRVGDVVEGLAWLDDVRSIAFRVERSGRRDDFELPDLKLRIIDAEHVAVATLADTPDALASIECPERAAPDGGELRCEAIARDGRQLELRLTRSGADYEIESHGVEPGRP